MEYEQIIKHWKDKKIATVVDLRESLSSYSIIFAYNSAPLKIRRLLTIIPERYLKMGKW